MAHIAADGSKWTNASQARKVPGKAQGDGKQPVSKFSKPDAPRADTAKPAASDDSQQAPNVDVSQDGDMFVVTAKFPSADEAHAAAAQLSGAGDQDSAPAMAPASPAHLMM